MPNPLAYFLTWHTYGTWLHGDERGAVDRDHNVPGNPALATNAHRLAWEQTQMRSSAVELSPAARVVVEVAVTDHCRYRGWTLHALAVRSNHVHVVVGYAGVEPEKVMSQLKAWATRRLREAGHVGRQQRVWVDHGSTPYLWDAHRLSAAIRYVLEGQDDRR